MCSPLYHFLIDHNDTLHHQQHGTLVLAFGNGERITITAEHPFDTGDKAALSRRKTPTYFAAASNSAFAALVKASKGGYAPP